VEADLLQDKLKKQEARHLSAISTDLSMLSSPTFDKNAEADGSDDSTASSPLITTPPDTKSLSTADTISEVHDPPSPPMSDASAPLPKKGDPALHRTPAASSGLARKSRIPSADASATPKPRGVKAPSTAPRAPGARLSNGGAPFRTPANRSANPPRAGTHKIPGTTSLSHIRTLTAQMQRLEARVHSVRSKLPAPTHTPPRASPRASVNSSVPSTVTIRARKRTVGSTPSSVAGDDTTPTNFSASTSGKSHVPRLSTSGVSRLSFGPLPNRGPESDISRPSSRASISSYARPPSRTDMIPPPRPTSRASISGARTPLGRPRSSLSGSVHGHSQSMSRIEFDEEDENEFRTPSRRGTYSKFDPDGVGSAIPTPGGSAIPAPVSRRQSAGQLAGRRASNGALREGARSRGQKLSDLGETY
jgi:hypothetical protein